jgi:hypothetical protein
MLLGLIVTTPVTGLSRLDAVTASVIQLGDRLMCLETRLH